MLNVIKEFRFSANFTFFWLFNSGFFPKIGKKNVTVVKNLSIVFNNFSLVVNGLHLFDFRFLCGTTENLNFANTSSFIKSLECRDEVQIPRLLHPLHNLERHLKNANRISRIFSIHFFTFETIFRQP